LEEFIDFAVVLDAFPRRVIGWSLANHLRASLALEMALGTRQAWPGLVHHSDRGVQYACGDDIGGWNGLAYSQA
jgi:putative transposase